ncbi:MAG: 3-dehydroquinate synthase [Candidatus Petromonas sp.]|jgi:3-dehydroquinate synthase|nr:3-dehydroquinate synthase [Candidatus Petromonas sp.]
MDIVTVELQQKKYPIFIQRGLIKNIGQKLKNIYKNKKIAIITDTNVENLYGEKLRDSLQKEDYLIKTIIVEPGEKSKSFEALQKIYDELLDSEMTRGDLLITFGGGVVGDLGGFAASTFLRGIPFVQIPTSLLAQIDSSVGGKVAVNLPRGKNLVGSFYHPEAVFIDPDLLKTLDRRFLHDGMAEAIKYGLIKDKQLFQKLFNYETKEELFENMEQIIYRCCSIKKMIVEKDEKDTGERMLLNFGHTIGHAIEKYFKYEKYTHGEAVAIGMLAITKKSEEIGITEKGTADLIKEILIKYELPYEMPEMDMEKLMKTIGVDKKNKGQIISIVLLKGIGDSFIKKIDRDGIVKYIN